MKRHINQQVIGYIEISPSELSDIRAGAVPLAAAALIVSAAKLILDSSYYLGYAIGYIQASYD